jgi:hypothetical protein
MERWILDIVLKDANLNPQFQTTVTPIWLVVNADGLAQQFSTPTASISTGLMWNFPARLFLSVSNIATSYLYVTMCTFGPNNQGNIQLARSRIALRGVPRDVPKVFRFPLMCAQNSAQEFARLTACASLSPIAGAEGPRTYTNDARESGPFVPRPLLSV